jgi:hypothetical protein
MLEFLQNRVESLLFGLLGLVLLRRRNDQSWKVSLAEPYIQSQWVPFAGDGF